MECLSDEAFARLLDAGQSPPPDFDAHVVSCDRCRELWLRMIREDRERTVAGVVADTGEPGEPGAGVPDVPGRYMVIDLIGRGGMGEVFRAYDTRVHREVALKRVRTSAYDARARARFEREARAMGKLQHPNVVALHGVEELEHGDLVLVMEFVDGPSLSGWLGSDPARAEILQRFVEAGTGLAAAHVQGLLHRDFKPANVLISEHGAKVTDFGLAKVVGEGAEAFEVGSGFADAQISQVGVGVGTPAYMAPECFRGEATAASDQYAFCVALWEALVGERPTRASKGLAPPAEPPPWPTAGGPRWLGRVLRRGLSTDPQARWPSMEVLLHRLSPRRRAASAITIGGVGVALGIGGMFAVVGTPADPCSGVPSEVERLWGAHRRAEVADRMEARSGVDPGRVGAAVSEFVGRWGAAAEAVCRMDRRGEAEPAQRLRAQRCIEGVEIEATALIDELAGANGRLAERALDLVADLPPPETCHDLDVLDRGHPRVRDPSTRAAASRARTRIRRAVLMRDGGDAAGCLQKLRELDAEVDALGEPSLRAALDSAAAGCRLALGERPQAGEAALSAYARALQGEDDLLAVRAATQLATAWVDVDLGRAKAWADVARVTFERNGFRHPGRAAEVYSAAATVDSARGDPRAALATLRVGLEALEGLQGARIPTLNLRSRELGLLANRYEAAVEDARAVATEIEQVYGPLHSETLMATNLLGTTLASEGRVDASIEVLTDALSIARARSSSARELAYQEYLLAGSMLEGGRHEDARRRGMAALARLGSKRDWLSTVILRNLVLAGLLAGDPDEAERWLAQLRDPAPQDEVARADVRLLEAQAQLQRGEREAAESTLREVLHRLHAVDNEGRTHARPRVRFEALLALEELGAIRDVDRAAWDGLARSPDTALFVRAYVTTLRGALRYKRAEGVARMAHRLEALALRLGETEAASAYAEVAAAARR